METCPVRRRVVAGRCRPNTPRAVAFDLKAFFTVTGKDPVLVTAADVFDFLAHQRRRRRREGRPDTAVPPSWPRALRAVRAWLTPWTALHAVRAPPPRQLQALMTSLQAGRGLDLCIPN